jgi:hypothetical protein
MNVVAYNLFQTANFFTKYFKSLHTKFAAAAQLTEGKFLCAAKSWIKFLI